MKILELRAENFKRLKAVEIRPDGNIVQITGPNEAGKSSVLDAIWAALGGQKVAPKEPIRKGQDSASVELRLGDRGGVSMLVTRTWDRAEDGTIKGGLRVKTTEHSRAPAPQEVLDNLLGPMVLDPLEFDRMDDVRRADALKALVPGVDFFALERANARDFEERTIQNRRVRDHEAIADAIILPPGPVPEFVEVDALTDEMSKATQHNELLIRRKQGRTEAERVAAMLEQDAADKRAERTRIIEEAARLAEVLTEQAKSSEEVAAAKRKQLADADDLPEPINVEAIAARLKGASETNRAAQRAMERDEARRVAALAEVKSKELTDTMAARKQQARDAVASANLGVPGLELGENEKGQPVVMLAGVPFEQASDAERLRASVAIAMAAKPDLRIIRCKDGSLLDKRSLAILAEMATAKDYQIWIEVVRDEAGAGIFIEDGGVEAINGEPAAKKRGRK